MLGEDVSQEHAWQFSQELRLASNFSGPLNFSAGANFLHYQTVEDYYVFFNAISLLSEIVNESQFYGGTGIQRPMRHTNRSILNWWMPAILLCLPPRFRTVLWVARGSIPIR